MLPIKLDNFYYEDYLRENAKIVGIQGAETEPLRIQFGSNVVYWNTPEESLSLQRDRHVNNVAGAKHDILMALLEVAQKQSEGQQSANEATLDHKGTINIDIGKQRILRYSKGGIEVNAIADAGRIAAEKGHDSNTVDEEYEDIQMGPDPEVAPLEEGLLAELREVEALNKVVSEMEEESAIATGEPEATPIEAEAIDNKLTSEPVNQLANSLANQKPQPAWLSESDRQARLQQVYQTASEPAIAAEPAATDAPAINLKEALEQTTEKVAAVAEQLKDRIPAAAIALVEVHDKLKEPTRQWIQERVKDLNESGVLDELKSNGAEAARQLWGKVQELPGATRDRALADAVTTIVKELGDQQGNYQTPSYTFKVTGTNQYSVSDRQGNELLSFKHSGMMGVQITKNELNFAQQVAFIRAGSEIAADQMQETAGKVKRSAQNLLDKLGSLAPEGAKEKLREMKAKQVAEIGKALTSSSAAIAGVFIGKTFSFQQEGANLTVSRNGDGTEVLRASGESVQSRLTDGELSAMTSAAQAVAEQQKAHSPKVTAAAR